jgi:hypothetical protein
MISGFFPHSGIWLQRKIRKLHMSLNSINGIMFRNLREAMARKTGNPFGEMNYSNIDCQTEQRPHEVSANKELIVMVGRDGKRHLVVSRKNAAKRRGMSQFGVAWLALFASVAVANAEFNISTGVGTFTPSFRDLANTDAGSTTYWGWGSGAFDGPTNNENIDLPPVTLGAGGLNGTLSQGADPRDIVSSGNSIYTFTFTSPSNPLTLSLGVPTTGTVGAGFTTIILQGVTMNFGTDTTFPDNSFIFPEVGGVTPTVVVGQNNASPFKLGQFWAKYEIPGNSANYQIGLGLAANHISISRLEVDTLWSATGYAPDSASAIPEPGAGVFSAIGVAALILRRRRAQKGAAL